MLLALQDERIAANEHDQASMKRSEHLEPVQGVFAMGDCCAYIGTPLPALAQACHSVYICTKVPFYLT